MRTRFDQFSKQLLVACLSEAGNAEAEHETSSEPQKVDVWFVPREPSSGPIPARIKSSAVLGTMALHAALIEPFHQTPQTTEILTCVGKQLSVHAELRRASEKSDMPLLWIVSSGRPRTAMRELGFVGMPRAASGVYTAARGFRLRLVVVSELPKTRRTILLRLLGAGRTFRNALQELEKLPADAWETKIAVPWLVRYRLEIGAMAPAERTMEEEAIMTAQTLYEQWERERIELGEKRGKSLGLDEGLAPLVRQFERRLGRELAESEHAILRERLTTLGPERLGDVVLDLSSEELGRWLADPEAK